MWLLAATLVPAHALTPEELDAILTFRAEHLEVRQVNTVVPGSVTVSGSGWGWGPPPFVGYAWGPPDVWVTQPELIEDWRVYQGPQALSVPEYLQVVGKPGDADDLERRIRKNHRWSNVLAAVAVTGLGAGVAGLAGTFAAPTAQEPAWAGVGLGGLGLAIVGAAGSSAERDRAARLTHDFPTTRSLGEVQEEVRSYNESLRQELGLTPDQAYRELDRHRQGPPGT